MKNENQPEFDRYAHSYASLHESSIHASGEEPGYFAAYKVAYMARALQASHAAPGSILDFGCGIGGTLRHLAEAFPDASLWGMDVSGESLAVAAATQPSVEFRQIRDGVLPMDDASVDAAIAACVYHHIEPGERLQWTRELKRVLKPGGYLFVFEHNPSNPLTRKVVRDCPFDEDAILLPSAESLQLLRDAGFRDDRLDYIVFFPRFLRLLRPMEAFLSSVPLGAQYAAHGRA